MTDRLKEIVTRITTKVFEKMAFVEVVEEGAFPEKTGEGAEKKSIVQITSTMKFSGHCSGTISVSYSHKLAKFLAANILGIEIKEISMSEDVVDSVREITNIISGSILTELAAGGDPINLSVPTIRVLMDENDFFDDESAVVVRFATEEKNVVSKMKCTAII